MPRRGATSPRIKWSCAAPKLAMASVAMAWTLTGCQPFIDGWQSATNNHDIMKLQVGMKRDEVVALMGQPQKREAYGQTEFLIYRTDYRGASDNANFTPVAIIDGRVAGWGRNYYDNTVRSKVDADINIKQQIR